MVLTTAFRLTLITDKDVYQSVLRLKFSP